MRGRWGRACIATLGVALIVVPAAQARPADTVATAAAVKAKVKVNTVSSPPRTAVAPGSSFTVTGRVKNMSSKTRTAHVRITLRRTKGSYAHRAGAKTARIRAGHTLRYRVRATIPRNLANGTYYARACADYGRKTPLERPPLACKFAKRRLIVRKVVVAAPRPNTPAASQPQAQPQPAPAPAAPARILVFTTRD